MEILNFDYCFKKLSKLLQKQREASTFNCNAGRLLFKNKANKYTDSQKQEIVMSKNVTQNTFQKNRILCLDSKRTSRRDARRREQPLAMPGFK
jgi:hypothetical protein